MKRCAAYTGVSDGEIIIPGEAHHIRNYYRLISVGVVKGDTGHSQSPMEPRVSRPECKGLSNSA